MAARTKSAKRKAAPIKQAQTRLEKYQSMRDFGVTAEPSGKGAKVAASKRLRYVIQKHAASRLHYDFRLELNGTFLSWAVTRGPSLDPGEKRLAVEVEDHPLDYGDFEGTIPKGQYGGGTVMLWDRGYWEPDGDPEAMLKKGGKRMHLPAGNGKDHAQNDGQRNRKQIDIVLRQAPPKGPAGCIGLGGRYHTSCRALAAQLFL